jgi:membrane protein DedA with SNARE-associated domain
LYLGLGALLTAEEAGIFLLPGDISIIAAGVYASQGQSFVLASWLVATVGMIAGSLVLFSALRRSTASQRAMPERARSLIQRHGAVGVGLARLVPGFRNATVVAAASADLSPRTFLLGLVPAAAVWSAILLAVGWFGGNAILALLGRVDGYPAVKFLSIGIVLATGILWATRVWMTAQKAES